MIEEATPMAVCVVFEFPGVTVEQYDEACRQMNNGRPFRSLSEWPVSGVLSHVAGPTPDGWSVVDVWESEETFHRFGQVLAPVLEKIGIPSVSPRMFTVHNLVVQ